MTKTMKTPLFITAVLACMIALSGCAGMGDLNDSAGKRKGAAELAGMGKEQIPNAMSELTPEQAKDPKALEAKADSLIMINDLGSALYLYQKAHKLASKEVKPRLNTKIAFVHLREGRFQIAYNLLNAKDKPKNIAHQMWLGLGLAQMSLGDMEQAQASLQKSVASGKASWKAYNALGVIYDKMERPEKALQMFNQAIMRQPKVPALYNNRGLSYMMLGKKKSAEYSFLQALKLDGDHKLARNNLALLYSSQKRWDEARRAFNLSVGEAKAHNNVGVLMAHEGRYLDAGEQFRKAVETQPTYYSMADRYLENVRNMAQGQMAMAPAVKQPGRKKPKTADLQPAVKMALADAPKAESAQKTAKAVEKPLPIPSEPAQKVVRISAKPAAKPVQLALKEVSPVMPKPAAKPVQPALKEVSPVMPKPAAKAVEPALKEVSPVMPKPVAKAVEPASGAARIVLPMPKAPGISQESGQIISRPMPKQIDTEPNKTQAVAKPRPKPMEPAPKAVQVSAPKTGVAQPSKAVTPVMATPRIKSAESAAAPKNLRTSYVYHVQVASIRDFSKAQKLMNSYMEKGFSCHISIWKSPKGQRWFRLLLGPYENKDQMKSSLAKLTGKEGLRDYRVIRKQAG